MQNDVYINALGAFLPDDPVPSSEMEDYLGCIYGEPSRNRAFVLRQNKIKTRHYALDKNGTARHSNTGMATRAIQDAIGKSEISKNDITYLATATTMGDMLTPGLASHVHAALGLPPLEIASFQSVCAGSLMALKSAFLQVKTGEHRCAAVSGSEFASRYFRPEFYEGIASVKAEGKIPFDADFLRFTLSDGAGAALLENKPNERQLSLKVHWIDLRSYADRFDPCMTFGIVQEDERTKFWGDFGSPIKAAEAGALILKQDFSQLQKMIEVWVSHYLNLIDIGKIEIENIKYFCSHYSSHSLREEAMGLLQKTNTMIAEEKWFSNLYTKGNTGTASIFIMLEELYGSGKLVKGDRILCHVPESGRCINGFMLLEVA
jgi:3-oxoacyl-[acyl-carrier-protein] synthase-3